MVDFRICLLLVIGLVNAQGAKGKSPEYEFVFSVPTVIFADNPHIMISTPSMDPIKATVTIPGTTFEVDKTITQMQYVDITLPGSVYLVGTGKQNNKTVVVRCSGEASVHLMANEGKSGDGFLVLHTRQLGTEHYVLSYTPDFGTYDHISFICVSALTEATNVDIFTKAGKIYHIVLRAYESYQLVGGGVEDFSGSRVVSDHEVTVVTGTQCSTLGSVGGFCDALVEQMPPVQIWGTHIVISPFMGKDDGYKYRVLGTNYTTNATISNIGTVSLTGGQWYEGDITDDTMVSIVSDYPILVMQYIKGGASSMPRTDPSMILVPSTNMYTNSITFSVYKVMLFIKHNYYIHAIIDCDKVDGLTYDSNTSMAVWERLTTADGDMCSIRGTVSPGKVHNVGHPDQDTYFTVAVYGLAWYGHESSYAYPAGIRDTSVPPSSSETPRNEIIATTSSGPCGLVARLSLGTTLGVLLLVSVFLNVIL